MEAYGSYRRSGRLHASDGKGCVSLQANADMDQRQQLGEEVRPAKLLSVWLHAFIFSSPYIPRLLLVSLSIGELLGHRR
jgi:hypothetical protein